MAISMDREVHAKILRAVSAGGGSVSAWMTEAARNLLRVSEGLKAVAEWEAEHGTLTSAELEAARRRVEPSSDRRPRRKKKAK
jgi:hypothetical protein